MLVSTGIMLETAIKLKDYYSKLNLSIGLIHLPVLQPLNTKKFLSLIKNTKTLISIEEHSEIGGLGSIISDLITSSPKKIQLIKISILNNVIKGYGRQHNQIKLNRIDFKSCQNKINKILKL